MSWQWPLFFGLILIRLLAPGWLILLTLWTLGLPAFALCAPLLFGAYMSAPEQHPLIKLADVFLLVAAFTIPDGGDNSGYHIPVLTLLRGDPEISEKNLIGRALVWLGISSALAYAIVMLVLWAKIGEQHGWITLGFT